MKNLKKCSTVEQIQRFGFSPNCAFYSQKFIKLCRNTQNLLRISSQIDKNYLRMLKNDLKIALFAPPRALNYTQSPPRAPQEPLGLLKDSPRAPQEVLGAPKRVPKRPQSLQKVPRRHPRGSVSENFWQSLNISEIFWNLLNIFENL